MVKAYQTMEGKFNAKNSFERIANPINLPRKAYISKWVVEEAKGFNIHFSLLYPTACLPLTVLRNKGSAFDCNSCAKVSNDSR